MNEMLEELYEELELKLDWLFIDFEEKINKLYEQFR
jgi:hypothetical protein|tara:strand:+ start:288 stop:395 length:108 start_codon:yes stop_codon:yes gene_type:complete